MRPNSIALSLVSILAITYILYVGQSIFIPIFFSIVTLYIITGLADFFKKIPLIKNVTYPAFHYSLAILLIAGVLGMTVSMIVTYLERVLSLAPNYQESLLGFTQQVFHWLGIDTEPDWDSLRQQLLNSINFRTTITSTFSVVATVIGNLIVVGLFTSFLFIEKSRFQQKISTIFPTFEQQQQLMTILSRINQRIGAYLALKTLISLFLALVSWGIMVAMDLQLAGFWAALIFLLNFIPYLGSLLGVILPSTFGFIQFGDNSVFYLIIMLTSAQFIIGNFIDPYLMGNSLNLSPFAILLSLMAWSMLWGIPGAFLAIPVTASLVMVLNEFPSTRIYAVLLSSHGHPDKASS